MNAALRNYSKTLKISHKANAKERLDQTHKVMGIPNTLSLQLESLFNRWSQVRIADPELKKLILLAMVPNKEVLTQLQKGQLDEISTYFIKMCDAVYEYAQTSPTQQLATTGGTLFGAYNALNGYFQNVRGL